MVEGSSAFLSYLRLQGLGRELARASVSNAVVKTSREALNIKSTVQWGDLQTNTKKMKETRTGLDFTESI